MSTEVKDLEIVKETAAAVVRAKEMIVSTDAELTTASEFLRGLKTIKNRIDGTFDGPISDANKSHKSILEAKKEHMVPINEASDIIKSKVCGYQNEQARIRREEDQRLRAEAQKAAEDQRLAEAESLEKSGRNAEAMAVVSAPVVVPAVRIAPPPKTQGVTSRTVWRWRVTAPDLVPREYLKRDDVKIGGVVRSMRGETNIPGIEAFPDSSLAVSGY